MIISSHIVVNISLPDPLKSYVDEQVVRRRFGTSSEYVRGLIRRDQDRQRLRRLLLDRAHSAPAVPAGRAHFQSLRAPARKLWSDRQAPRERAVQDVEGHS